MIIRNCTTKAQKGPQTTGIIGQTQKLKNSKTQKLKNSKNHCRKYRIMAEKVLKPSSLTHNHHTNRHTRNSLLFNRLSLKCDGVTVFLSEKSKRSSRTPQTCRKEFVLPFICPRYSSACGSKPHPPLHGMCERERWHGGEGRRRFTLFLHFNALHGNLREGLLDFFVGRGIGEKPVHSLGIVNIVEVAELGAEHLLGE